MSRRTPILFAALIAALLAVLWITCAGSDLDRRIPVGRGGELTVDIVLGSGVSFDKGSLEIVSHAADEVRVVADIRGWGDYAVDLDVRERGDDVIVSGRVDGFLYWMFGGPRVDTRVYVPQGYRVSARIDGGPLRLEDLVGPVSARVEGSDILLRRAEGEVTLTALGGDVRAEDVAGSLRVESEESDVSISGVDGALQVRTQRGSIQVSSVRGPVDLVTERGGIEIERVRGDVRAASQRGRIEVRDVEGDIDLETDRGAIAVSDLAGTVRARSGRGGIEVGFRSDPAGVIETARGSIQLRIPAQARFVLDAETARGELEIDDELPLERADPLPELAAGARPAREGLRSGRGERVSGSVGGGGPLLRVHTDRGAIHLEQE